MDFHTIHTPSLRRMAGLLAVIAILLGATVSAHAISLSGQVVDSETGRPLPGATVRLMGVNHFVVSDSLGRFLFSPLPDDVLGLSVRHVGYQPFNQYLPALLQDVRVTVRLEPQALNLDPVILEEALRAGDNTFTLDPSVALGGPSLQQELGGTLAETLAEEPGISQRTLGPAPARPVLRGMGGDRLRILENGRSAGDLSATSSDHAVAIDPATAHEITVFRGPETVLYGPATPGGVVDVERSAPLDRLDQEHGHARFTMQGETASQAWVAGGDITEPVGPVVLHVDGSTRSAANLATPLGELDNTGLTSHTLTGSAAWSPGLPSYLAPPVALGAIGASATMYESEYGIPGGFIGGHKGGVDIDLQRRRYDGRARIDLNRGAVRTVELDGSFADYTHTEYESNGRVGMRFDVLTTSLRAVARMRSFFGADAGAVGFEMGWRDYETGGLTFTPNTLETSAAAFAYARWAWHRWALRAGLRMDTRDIAPDIERTSLLIGQIADRRFTGPSGSVAVSRVLAREVSAHASVTRSFRAPGVEELFSEGPHLAAYSYEVGNPRLGAETGWSGEFGITHVRPRFEQRFTVFATAFDSYLYARSTGHPNARRNDLIEYRMDAADALFTGAETSMEIDLGQDWWLAGSGSLVWADNRDEDRPLERIPPFNGRLGLTWAPSPWALTVRGVGAARQWRVGDFEDPTAAWLRLDLLGSVELPWKGTLHVISLSVTNVTDTAYRNHLSRIKAIMPEPGRSASLVYRIYL